MFSNSGPIIGRPSSEPPFIEIAVPSLTFRVSRQRSRKKIVVLGLACSIQ